MDDVEKYTRLGVGLAEITGLIVGAAYGVDTSGINKGVNIAVDAGFQDHPMSDANSQHPMSGGQHPMSTDPNNQPPH